MAQFLLQQHPEQIEPVRVMPIGTWFNSNHWMSHGISSVGGYHPAKLSRIHALLLDEQLLYTLSCARVLGVQYVVAQERIETTAPLVWEGVEGAVYAFPEPASRAWVTGRWTQSPGAAGCLGLLFGSSMDPQQVVVLDRAPSAAVDSTAVGSARITEYAINRVALQVQSSAPGLLVLRDAYHSGWRATVNATAAPVLEADCLLRAIEIPSGTSEVVFEFEHPGLAAGLRLTLGALLIILVLIGVGIGRRRRLSSGPLPVGSAA
jgi:hypothetical protein